jgi:hypothetical protein
MSHTQIEGREEVDSRLLMVGSQIASLTPGPSFAHNLGGKSPNCQCKGIFDIYVSRHFQWHQEHPNARCFGPCCQALNIRESRRTPNLQLFQVLGFTPHLAKVGVRQLWPLQMNCEVLGIPEDSQVPISGVWVSSSHSFESGVATQNNKTHAILPLFRR